MTVSTILACKDKKVKLVTFFNLGTEVEAEVLDEEIGSFLILTLDSLSRVAGFADGLVIDGEVRVFDIVGTQPVVLLLKGDINGPLKLRGRTDDFAASNFTKSTASDLLTFLRVGGDSED